MPLTFVVQSHFIFREPRACTICLSRHSGLSMPYQLERRIMVQKKKEKSSLFEIDKGRETVFPIKHSGLIWAARLERWSDSAYALKNTSGPRAIPAVWLSRREEMHSVRLGRLQETRAYLLNIKGVASDAGSFRRDRWPDDRCVTETMANVQ